MNKLIIRNAQAQDLEACYQVETLSFSAAEAASKERIALRIDQYPQGFLVAEYQGNVVGHVNSGATDSDDISDEEFKELIGHVSSGCNQVIFSLAVLPEYRELGVARSLLERFIKESRKAGKKSVLLLCKEELIPYYQRFGFMDRGLSASTHGGVAWHEMAMIL